MPVNPYLVNLMPYKVLKPLVVSGGGRVEPGQVLQDEDFPFPKEQLESLISIEAIVEETASGEVVSEPPTPPPPANPLHPNADGVVEGAEGIDPAPLIDANNASEGELAALPHIGKAIAQKIIKSRPYQSVDAVAKVTGLKSEQWAEVAPLLTV